MVLTQLDAKMLHSAFIHACYSLIQQREPINAINVFPVADGDTGDNMAATAKAIITHSKPQPTVETVCKSIANAGILGARGNSGMIFSQFFNGLLEHAPLSQTLSTAQFADMVTIASKSVRDAIAHPMEGTILTVMDAWAKCLSIHSKTASCFNDLMQQCMAALDNALQTTASTLDVLRKAHVVDAGALGFSTFVKGFAEFLKNPQIIDNEEDLILADAPHEEHVFDSGPPECRYCTEAMLIGEQISPSDIKKAVNHLGDSIVLSANVHMCRLHIHSNTPWDVFSALKPFGKINYPKVDDMLRQFDMLHQPKHRIALVTDTCASIPQSIADEHHIHFIAINVHIDEHDLLDRYSLDDQTFYDDIATSKVYPTTSFPSPALIEDKLSHLSHLYDHVIVLSVAKVLSGTHDAMAKVAEKYSNVRVIDTRQAAASQGLLVHYAAQLIQQDLPFDDIVAAIEHRLSKTKLLVMVNQFDSLIRSGRVSRLKGKIAQFSGIKPILALDEEGKAVVFDKAFSETKALAKLVQQLKTFAQGSTLETYCVIHAGAPEKAAEFAKMTTEAFGKPPLFIESVSTAIGLHAGKGCVAIAGLIQ